MSLPNHLLFTRHHGRGGHWDASLTSIVFDCPRLYPSPHSCDVAGSRESATPLDLADLWAVAIGVSTRQSNPPRRYSEPLSERWYCLCLLPCLCESHLAGRLATHRACRAGEFSTIDAGQQPLSLAQYRSLARRGEHVHVRVAYGPGSTSLPISRTTQNSLSVHLADETHFDDERSVSFSHFFGVRPSSPGEATPTDELMAIHGFTIGSAEAIHRGGSPAGWHWTREGMEHLHAFLRAVTVRFLRAPEETAGSSKRCNRRQLDEWKNDDDGVRFVLSYLVSIVMSFAIPMVDLSTA